jgi:hypothetical protein
MTVFRPQHGHATQIYSYYVPSSSEWCPTLNFNGNVYFNVEHYADKKIQALQIYENEMRPYPHSRSYENVLNLMKVWGSEIGLMYAEKFETMRIIFG